MAHCFEQHNEMSCRLLCPWWAMACSFVHIHAVYTTCSLITCIGKHIGWLTLEQHRFEPHTLTYTQDFSVVYNTYSTAQSRNG